MAVTALGFPDEPHWDITLTTAAAAPSSTAWVTTSWTSCPHGVTSGGYCYQCAGTATPAAGWRCPQCGTCWAPTVAQCTACTNLTGAALRCGCPSPARHACGVCHSCWLPLR